MTAAAVDEFVRLRYPEDAVPVTRWHDAVEVLRTPALLRETGEGAFFHGTVDKINGEEHTLRRRTFSPAFRQGPLETYRRDLLLPALERLLPQSGERADLAPLAERIFLHFAAGLVGIEDAGDPERSEVLRRLYRVFSAAEGVRHAHEPAADVFAEAQAALDEYVERFLLPSLRSHERREDESLMTLFAQRADPAWHDPEQLAREAALFVIASVDTSASFLVHLMDELWRWFAAHPEDAALRGDAGFLRLAVDEALRLHPNLPESPRVAAEDVVLANGIEVRAGRHVLVRKDLVNRDPEVFGSDADRFDPRRETAAGVPRYGISFGAGAHKCIGLPVVFGQDGLGSHAQVAIRLFAAGMEPDPDRRPVKAATYIDRFESYPVVLR